MNFPSCAPDQKRDACGTGFVVDIAGNPCWRPGDLVLTCMTPLTRPGGLSASSGTGNGTLIFESEEA